MSSFTSHQNSLNPLTQYDLYGILNGLHGLGQEFKQLLFKGLDSTCPGASAVANFVVFE